MWPAMIYEVDDDLWTQSVVSFAEGMAMCRRQGWYLEGVWSDGYAAAAALRMFERGKLKRPRDYERKRLWPSTL